VLTPDELREPIHNERRRRAEKSTWSSLADSARPSGAAIRRALVQPGDTRRNKYVEGARPTRRRTNAAVLSNPDIDIVYCELPTKGDRIAAGSGTMVELDGLGGAPALTVSRGLKDIASRSFGGRERRTVVDRCRERARPPRIRRLFGLLAVRGAGSRERRTFGRFEPGVYASDRRSVDGNGVEEGDPQTACLCGPGRQRRSPDHEGIASVDAGADRK